MKLARNIVQAIALVLALALPLMLAVSSADARVGGGLSSGSRGATNLLRAAEHIDGTGYGAAVQSHPDPARQPRDRRGHERRAVQ